MSIQRFFLHNGHVVEKNNFILPAYFDACIYEVVRVIEGVVLFAEDHVDRLFASLSKKKVNHSLDLSVVLDEFYQVVRLNNHAEGNIRYEVYVKNGQAERWVYYVPHSYPSEVLYQQGVNLITLKAERNDPAVKMYHNVLRKQVEQHLQQTHAYEVALVDSHEQLTEGSKSNLFFVREDKIYTAPDAMVLSGITRKKVIDIIVQCSLPFIFEPVKLSDLHLCEAAFLTGTSPKVLPIKQIDNISFSVNHPFIVQIRQEYDLLIKNYVASRKIDA